MNNSQLDEILEEATQLCNEVEREIHDALHDQETEIQNDDKELVEKIQNLSFKALKHQERIRNSFNPITLDSDDVTAIPLLEAAYLNIEHEYNQEKPAKGLELNHQLQKETLLDRLKNDEKDLRKILIDKREELSTLTTKVEKLNQSLAEDEKIIKIFEERKTELINKRNQKPAGLAQKINNELKDIKNIHRYRLGKLRGFLDEYFPPPPTKPQQRQSPRYSQAETELKSMADTLQLLLQKSNDSPHDPWIEIDDTFHEPYINMLKQVRVVVKHPYNKNLISLDL